MCNNHGERSVPVRSCTVCVLPHGEATNSRVGGESERVCCWRGGWSVEGERRSPSMCVCVCEGRNSPHHADPVKRLCDDLPYLQFSSRCCVPFRVWSGRLCDRSRRCGDAKDEHGPLVWRSHLPFYIWRLIDISLDLFYFPFFCDPYRYRYRHREGREGCASGHVQRITE